MTSAASNAARLSAVAVALEIEVEVEDATLECGLETLLVAVLPLFVEDLERGILVWRASVEDEQACAAMFIRVRVLLCMHTSQSICQAATK